MTEQIDIIRASAEVNVRASVYAKNGLELLEDLVAGGGGTFHFGHVMVDTHAQEQFIKRYYIAIYEALETKTRQWRDSQPKAWVVPMNDAEAKKFESSTLTFGKWTGYTLAGAMQLDYRYFEWLAGAPDTFKKELNRYLAWREKQ